MLSHARIKVVASHSRRWLADYVSGCLYPRETSSSCARYRECEYERSPWRDDGAALKIRGQGRVFALIRYEIAWRSTRESTSAGPELSAWMHESTVPFSSPDLFKFDALAILFTIINVKITQLCSIHKSCHFCTTIFTLFYPLTGCCIVFFFLSLFSFYVSVSPRLKLNFFIIRFKKHDVIRLNRRSVVLRTDFNSREKSHGGRTYENNKPQRSLGAAVGAALALTIAYRSKRGAAAAAYDETGSRNRVIYARAAHPLLSPPFVPHRHRRRCQN